MPYRRDPVLSVLSCTTSKKQLARQVRFLKEEIEILRSRIKGRVALTHEDRARLIRFGLPLGDTLKQLITVVKHVTFKRWLRASPPPRPSKKPGPPRKPEEIRQLVIRIAKEGGFGYGRILGELVKLGITDISKATIRRILKEAGLGPSPQKHRLTWDQYLKAHAETLWACDFFTKRVSGPGVARSSRTCSSSSTLRADASLPAARRFARTPSGRPARPRSSSTRSISSAWKHRPSSSATVMGKFGTGFNEVLRASGCRLKRIPRGIPVMNAFAKRVVRSIKTECLDYFVCFSESHLDYLIEENLEHYHEDRPHQGIDNRTIEPRHPTPKEGKIVLKSRLGGVLKTYERQAA